MVVVQGGPTYGDVSGGPARLCSSRPLLLHNKREPQVVLSLLLFYGAGEESARYVPRGLPRDTPHRFPVRESFGFVPGAKARRAATRSRNPSGSTPREVFTSRDGLRRETQSPQSIAAPAVQGERSSPSRGLVLPALSGSGSNQGRGGWVKQEKGSAVLLSKRHEPLLLANPKVGGRFLLEMRAR